MNYGSTPGGVFCEYIFVYAIPMFTQLSDVRRKNARKFARKFARKLARKFARKFAPNPPECGTIMRMAGRASKTRGSARASASSLRSSYAARLPKRLREKLQEAWSSGSSAIDGIEAKLHLTETLLLDCMEKLARADAEEDPEEAASLEREMRLLMAEYRELAKVGSQIAYQKSRTVTVKEIEAFVAALQNILVRNIRDPATLENVRREIAGLLGYQNALPQSSLAQIDADADADADADLRDADLRDADLR